MLVPNTNTRAHGSVWCVLAMMKGPLRPGTRPVGAAQLAVKDTSTNGPVLTYSLTSATCAMCDCVHSFFSSQARGVALPDFPKEPWRCFASHVERVRTHVGSVVEQNKQKKRTPQNLYFALITPLREGGEGGVRHVNDPSADRDGKCTAFEGSTRGIRPATSALPPHFRAIAHDRARSTSPRKAYRSL